MIRPLAAIICLAAGGCASHGVGGGPADYDSLKAATEECQAEHGRLVLRSGYDGRQLSSYECKIGGAK
ncbi:MAG: hypothetical protein ABI056_02915 [Caulobacteraceae bacterium]